MKTKSTTQTKVQAQQAMLGDAATKAQAEQTVETLPTAVSATTGASQPVAAGGTVASAACCGPQKQQTCCAPSAKASCCGAPAAPGSCGCK